MTYQNTKYILFSDRDFETQGSCPVTICNKNAFCCDVDDAINIIINKAMQQGKYVDVYLETAFPNKLNPKHIPNIPFEDFLGNTLKRYSDCLYNKTECQYKNARFHYINVRQVVDEDYGSDVLSRLRLFVNHYYQQLKSTKEFIANDPRFTFHLNFLLYSCIVATFLNTDAYIDSNLWTYYNQYRYIYIYRYAISSKMLISFLESY